MIIPIRTDYRMSRTPWVNYMILAVNVALYFLGYSGADAAAAMRTDAWLLHPLQPELHQFVTCVFLHGSFWHLAGNMLFLWVFGNAVNDRFGQVGYLTFYLAGGILACIGYMLLGGNAPVLGASGAISAVTGAYLVLLPRARVTVLVLLIWVLMPFEVSSLYFLLFQLVYNLWMSFSPSLTGQYAGGVAYVAHASGYVFGIVVASGLLIIRALPRDPFDLPNLIRASRRRHQFRSVVAEGYDPFSLVRPELKKAPAEAVEAIPIDPREAQLRGDIQDALSRHEYAQAVGLYLQLVQIAEDAVLPRQQQLDVANQLMVQQHYPAAADAYERFLARFGPTQPGVEEIHLMLGLVYSRYLHQYDKARKYLQLALERLRDGQRRAQAQAELDGLKRQ